MGLKRDLYKAFKAATLTKKPGPELKDLSEQVADAIVTWLTKQTFTITDMKASLEIEGLRLTAPVSISTMAPIMGIPNAGGPVSIPPTSLLLQPLNLSKTGGMGGSMMATGHAYIGKKARNVPKADTSEEWNSFTKVKLDPDKIRSL